MDNFREWLSDNLRYILLGLAIIIILAAAVFAVKFVSSLGSTGNTETEKQKQTETKKVEMSESNTETEKPSEGLIENDEKVLSAVQGYYAAMSGKDMETLKKLVPDLTEEEQQAVQNDNLIESYNNISSYSIKGVTEGSYVAFVTYDCKVVNIDTQVPSLARLYFQSNTDGSLYLADYKSDESTMKYLDELAKDEKVKKLISDVDAKYQQAVDSNEELKNIIDQGGSPVTESNLNDSSDSGVEAHQIVAANTECNVRAGSSEDAEILGLLYDGDEVTRIRILDNGWSEINYNGSTAYVMSDFLSEKSADADTQ